MNLLLFHLYTRCKSNRVLTKAHSYSSCLIYIHLKKAVKYVKLAVGNFLIDFHCYQYD